MNLQVRLHDLLTTEELAGRPDFALGSAIVSPSTRTIQVASGAVDVEPRVMQVLVVLADASGAVVTRDTLFRRCWGSPSVTNDSLNRAIGALRRVAASTDGAFDVETIPRTGYRLAVSPASTSAATRSLISRREAMAAGGAAVLASAGALAYWTARAGAAENPRVTDLIARSDEMIRNGSPPAAPVKLLEEAVAQEPGDARAWGRLALARGSLAEHAPPADVTAAVAATQGAARRALALDSRSADALAALALLPPYFGDWAAAERRMRGVLAVQPDHSPTRDALDFMLAAVGRAREGSLDRTRVAAREPLHVVHQFKLVYALWVLGDVAAADRAADRALQLWPRHPAVWFARLWTLAFTGRPERALVHVNDRDAWPKLPPGTIDSLRAAMGAMISRRPRDVTDAADGVVKMVGRGPSESVNAIMILNGLGEVDRAFDVASAYLLERGPLLAMVQWRPGQLSVTDQHRRKTNMLFLPVAREMQSDPRFMRLATDIGLARYWNEVGVEPDFLKLPQRTL